MGGGSSEMVTLLDLPRWTRAWADGTHLPPSDFHLRNSLQRISMPSVVALPHQCDRAWRGVRTRTRKLVLEVGPSADSAGSPQATSRLRRGFGGQAGQGLRPWLFFDLASDPLEMKNLAGDPARAGEIAELIALA